MLQRASRRGENVAKAYKATRVVDGISEQSIEDGIVVVEDENISSVGAAVDLPAGARTL